MSNRDGLDGFEAFMSEFVDAGSEKVRAALDALELQMAMLSPEDQEFIVGTKAVFDTGGGITPQAVQRVFQIAGNLNSTGHELLTEAPAISFGKMIKDLATVERQLSKQELKFAVGVAKKLKAGKPLTTDEMSDLSQLHTRKGF